MRAGSRLQDAPNEAGACESKESIRSADLGQQWSDGPLATGLRPGIKILHAATFDILLMDADEQRSLLTLRAINRNHRFGALKNQAAVRLSPRFNEPALTRLFAAPT
jgi:hypothetical protein